MDCKNARLLLDFARPVPGDLDALEAEALQQHLNQCPDCGPLAQSERRFDDAIGKVMTAVTVPDGLRTRLLARLDRDRDAFYRRFVVRRILPVAAAAAVLLVVGVMSWQWSQKPRELDPERIVASQFVHRLQRDRDGVNEWLREVADDKVTAPADFNYFKLNRYFMSDLGDHHQQVPTLLFVRSEENTAWVYVLSGKRFNLDKLKEHTPLPSGGGIVQYQIIRPPDNPHVAYLVCYTGDKGLTPFLSN